MDVSNKDSHVKEYFGFKEDSSLLEPLLPAVTDSKEGGNFKGTSIKKEEEGDSSRNRGYCPPLVPGASHDFSAQESSSATGEVSRVSSVSTLKEKSNWLGHFKKTVSSLLPKGESSRDWLKEAQCNDEIMIQDATRVACEFLKRGNKSEAKKSIKTALSATELFHFTEEDRPDDFNKEVENILIKAREQVMDDAQEEAYDLLRADPKNNEGKALAVLFKALERTSTQSVDEKEAPQYFGRLAKEELMKIRAEKLYR